MTELFYGALENCRLSLRDSFFYLKSKALIKRNENLVICNSFPKSGTHLLMDVVSKMNGLCKWNGIISIQSNSGRMNTLNHIKYKYQSVKYGNLIRSHLSYSDEIKSILESRKHKRFFIYRDPRSVVCSHANWLLNEPLNYLHDYYKNTLITFEERINCSILGKPIGIPFGSNISLIPFSDCFNMYKQWIFDENTFSVKFEDLVGVRGGGCEHKRFKTIKAMYDFLEIEIDEKTIKKLHDSLKSNTNQSHTFRKGQGGKISTWKNKFTPLNKIIFKENLGDLLIELGYENDYNW